jgi:hypothetical protein
LIARERPIKKPMHPAMPTRTSRPASWPGLRRRDQQRRDRDERAHDGERHETAMPARASSVCTSTARGVFTAAAATALQIRSITSTTRDDQTWPVVKVELALMPIISP